tara:strand:+ start:5194 stop:5736 length:543 start_codon:yes stop_codon:yes gene_type:complete
MEILEFKNEGIYVIFNKDTEECYVGSSTNLGNRFTKHKSLLKHNKHPNNLLQNAYNNNPEKIIFGVLEYCTEDILNKEQIYLDSLNSVYNITKDVINNTPSKESRIKMSKTRKDLYKQGILKPNGKPVIQTDLKDNFIQEFPSIMEAARVLGISKSSITRVLNGKYKQVNGFKFSYKLVL